MSDPTCGLCRIHHNFRFVHGPREGCENPVRVLIPLWEFNQCSNAMKTSTETETSCRSNPMIPGAKLGVGLLGCGAFGRFCLREFAAMRGLRAAAVADTIPAAARKTGEEFAVPVFAEIIGRHLKLYAIAQVKADEAFAHLTGDVCKDDVIIIKFYPKHGSWGIAMILLSVTMSDSVDMCEEDLRLHMFSTLGSPLSAWT
jgi:hypothetical protein